MGSLPHKTANLWTAGGSANNQNAFNNTDNVSRLLQIVPVQERHHVNFFGGFVKSWTSYPGPKFDLMVRLQ